MASQNYFDHTSKDGRTFDERITEVGYIWNVCGENIAAGYSDPQAVMDGWMNSPGHRANVLNQNFCEIGVGMADNTRRYWTQDFARECGLIF